MQNVHIRGRFDLEKLKEMINIGFTKFEIADFFGVSWNAIDKVILANNLPKPRRKQKEPNKVSNVDFINTLEDYGYNFVAASRVLGVSTQTIYNRYYYLMEQQKIDEAKEKWLTENAKYAEGN